MTGTKKSTGPAAGGGGGNGHLGVRIDPQEKESRRWHRLCGQWGGKRSHESPIGETRRIPGGGARRGVLTIKGGETHNGPKRR